MASWIFIGLSALIMWISIVVARRYLVRYSLYNTGKDFVYGLIWFLLFLMFTGTGISQLLEVLD